MLHAKRVWDRKTRDYGLPDVNFAFFRVALDAIATAADAANVSPARSRRFQSITRRKGLNPNEQDQSRQSGSRNGRRRDDPDHLEIHQRQADPSLSRYQPALFRSRHGETRPNARPDHDRRRGSY